MKSIIILVFSLISTILYSQKLTTEYYSKDWVKIKSNKGYYKREITTINDSLFEVKDFVKGKLQMTGSYTSIEASTPHGMFHFFDKKGNLIAKEIYSNGEPTGNPERCNPNCKPLLTNDYNFSYTVLNDSERTNVLYDASNPNVPQYPGGNQAFRIDLVNNIYYSRLARKQRIQGSVYVTIVLNNKSVIQDIYISKSVNPILDTLNPQAKIWKNREA